MRVIQERGWKTVVDCRSCRSTVEIMDVDLRAWHNYDYTGDYDKELGVVCPVCGTCLTFRESDIPERIRRAAWEVFAEQPRGMRFASVDYEVFWKFEMEKRLPEAQDRWPEPPD